MTAEAIQAWLVARLSEVLGVAPEEIDLREPLASYGLDSVHAVALSGELEEWLGRRLPPTLAYEYPTIEALAAALADEDAGRAAGDEAPRDAPGRANPAAGGRPRAAPIAIVGIGCRFPGADGVDGFWRLLREGVDAIREVPADRWDADAFFHPDAAAPGRMNTRWGGFLDRVDLFDPYAFGIAPREAARMDPQQRLLLEVTWEALEDAGLPRDALRGTPTGVFIGISSNDYGHLQLADPQLSDPHAGTGNALSIAANRISYLLDLRGPSLAVDTACSSSLVAVHLACQSLRAGECTLAIAGGVNVILAPAVTVNFTKAGFMAADGRCKAFDARADGYVRGEGAGVVILKPLDAALADGDPIYAVIRGTATNSDGRTNGLTAPSRAAQEAVIRAAYRQAGLSPGRAAFVECHGTGTALGDPIEAAALGAVLAEARPAGRPCAIGSVKTNIGHLEAAAGIAGLIKAALALRHRAIPPSLHYRQPNPYIPFGTLPLRVQQVLGPLPDDGAAAIAGVSAFGFGGTNAHVVLEEAPRAPLTATASPAPTEALVLPVSAHSAAALRERALALAASLEAPTAAAFADVCYTVAVRRDHQDHRIAVVGATREELVAGLRAGARATPHTGGSPAGAHQAVAFVFCGQGPQWSGMGRELLAREPFRRAAEACDALIRAEAGWSALEVLAADEADARLERTEIAQPALFLLQVALAALWRSWGVEPDVVVGHSVGEVAAAHVAGALGLADAVRVVVHRGRLMEGASGLGRMAAIELPADEAERLAAGDPERVWVAAVNSPTSTVLAGAPDALEPIVEGLRRRRIFARFLPGAYAFHSPQMAPFQDPLVRALEGLAPGPARVRILSTVTGEPADGAALDAPYWARNIREPVRFAAAVDRLRRDGVRRIVEIGPHPVLRPAIERTLGAARAEATVVASLRRGAPEARAMLEALGALYVAGVRIDWRGVYPLGGQCVALPRYPWQRERYWHGPAPWPSPAGRDGASDQRRDEPPVPRGPAPAAATAPIVAGDGRGALDRAALAAAPPARRRALVQAFLHQEVASALQIPPERLDARQPLPRLGLDSIMAVLIKDTVETTLGVQIDLGRALEDASVATLAEELSTALDGEAEARSGVAARPAEPTAAEFPLTYGQRALWFLHRLAPESAAYNVTLAARVRGPLDPEALRRAFQRLVERHPQLCATFPARDGVPVHRIPDRIEVPVAVTDVSDWTDDAVRQRLAEDAHRPFDLETGPVFRAHLYRRGPEHHLLLASVHHIVYDATSLVVMLDDLGTLYDAETAGRPAALPPPRASYAAYVRWQTEMLAGPDGERLWAYWRDQLAGDLADLDLPTDRPRPPQQTFRGAARGFGLEADLIARLRALAAREGTTLFAVLLAAYQTLLHRYTGQPDILVGVPMAGRTRPEFHGTVGYFINPVVLRARFDGDPPFRELLAQVRATVLGALDHQEFPFSQLVDRLRPDRDTSRSPLFQVMLNMIRARRLDTESAARFVLGADGARIRAGSLDLEVLPVEVRTAPFDLTLTVAEARGGLAASLQYSTDLFDAETIERMVGHYRTLLAAIAADPERTVSALPMLAETERRRLLIEWNDTTRPSPARAVPALFDEQTARTPDAVAARCGEEAVTYRALGRRANRLARALVAHGVGRDVVVPVLADRGLAFLTAVLAILKAGGAYLPLDPRHPPRRHAQVLAQAQSRLALVAAAHRDALAGVLHELPGPARPALLDLDALLAGEPTGGDADPLEPRAGLDDLAYVIFTSGSTGTPKGAMIEQRGLVNHLGAKIADLKLSAADVIAQTASQSFDISVWQMLAALVVGGCTLIVGDEAAGDPAALLREVERHGVTVLEVVPSLLLPLIEHAAAAGAARPRLRRLRWLLPTGEALPPELCRQWFALYPDIPMVNAYGPAECADDVTHGFITGPPGPDVIRMPIGRPIANTRLYIVDRHLQPVPIGVVGELCVAGDGVGRGYLNDPARTAEAFLADPFSATPGARLYRTGDLARYRADGVIEFVGRRDDQVKVRGFRIELAEIEAVLDRHPEVRACAVTARDEGPGRRRLVAYVVPASGRDDEATADGLRDFLRGRLPEYMVPSAFVLLPALPLTPNGKVDRRALPAPRGPAAPDTEFVPPRTEIERTLARIWADVLGLERVGAHDNFFALGGDSIQSIRVLVRAGQAGLRLSPAQFFQHQTVAELAAAAEAAGNGPGPSPVPAAAGWIAPAEAAVRAGVPPEEVEDAYPLAPMQSEMLAQALRAPRTGVYVEQLSATLLGELDPDALRRAWACAFARHPALRTGFLWDRDGHPAQVVRRSVTPAWRLEDLTDLDADAQRRRLDDYLARDLEEGFDLSTAPLARFAVFRTSARAHRLVWTLHHLLADAWSGGLVLDEVLTAYDALRARGSPPSAPVRPFREFVAWVARQDRSQAAAFWREALDAADLPTPLAAPWRPSPLVGHAEWRQALTPEQTRALGEAARAARVTPATLAQGAWALVLAAHSGRREVVFGVTTAGRPAGLPGAETMVGLLINTLPLRMAVEPRAPVEAWLGALHAAHEAVRRYEFCAADEIRAWIGAPEDAPLFHTALRFQNFPVDAALRARAGSLRPADVRFVDRWGYPVSVVAEPGEVLGLTLAHDPHRVDAATARRLLAAFAAALTALATGGAGHLAAALGAAEERL